MESFEAPQFARPEDGPQASLAETLRHQITIEPNDVFKHAIERIAEAFALAEDAVALDDIRKQLDSIENYQGYLFEKYRHTQEERDYMKSVQAAVAHLESKIRERRIAG